MLTVHYRTRETDTHLRWLASPEAPFLVPPRPDLIVRQPPRELFVRGRAEAFGLLSLLPEHGFAVVGTRRPQARSRHLARARIRMLEGSRLIILSGLALGIDTEAHRAALDAGLPTVAILGSPLDEIYPTENRGLAEQIVQSGGLLVSEVRSGTAIAPHFFLLRNRLIAGWAKATWIVEAGFRSGALNTASWAWDHDRDTYATPCFPGDPAYAGNQGLVARHKAYPFWEPSVLGQTWPKLSTLGHPQRIRPLPPLWSRKGSKLPEYNDGPLSSDASHLKKEVRRATVQQGGASVDSLLEWALAREWDPQRFFEALRVCLDERRIEDHGGILCSLASEHGRP